MIKAKCVRACTWQGRFWRIGMIYEGDETPPSYFEIIDDEKGGVIRVIITLQNSDNDIFDRIEFDVDQFLNSYNLAIDLRKIDKNYQLDVEEHYNHKEYDV